MLRLNRVPWFSLAATLAAVLLFLLPAASEVLLLELDGVWWAEPWRIVSCHWVHWSVEHLVWDAATLLLVGWLVERRSRAHLVVSVVLSAVAIPVVVALTTDLPSYAGLSGIDVGLYGLLATLLVRQRWATAGLTLRLVIAAGIAALVTKLVWEAATGDLWFVSARDSGFVPVPVAHLAGAMVGFVVGLAQRAGRAARAGLSPGVRITACSGSTTWT